MAIRRAISGEARAVVTGAGGALVEEISMEDWHWIVGVNFWGVVSWWLKRMAPGLFTRGMGRAARAMDAELPEG
jgi:hypothetical protein